MFFFIKPKDQKTWGSFLWEPVASMAFLWSEKVFLLSKIPGNRTVGFRRSKKRKRSTRSRLRVDPGFASFDKLQKVGFSPYLGLIPIFSVFRMFESIEAIGGCWIGPKTWDRINTIFLKPNGAARSCSTAVWV